MDELNDIANERLKSITINDDDTNDNDSTKEGKFPVKPEKRSDNENEALADYLVAKFRSPNRLPFLAVGYSGIPRATIDRHVTTALEKGLKPVKLFMHLIKREPLWRNYKQRKRENEAGSGDVE